MIRVWWDKEGEIPKPLNCKIKLEGAEEDFDFLTITSPDKFNCKDNNKNIVSQNYFSELSAVFQMQLIALQPSHL